MHFRRLLLSFAAMLPLSSLQAAAQPSATRSVPQRPPAVRPTQQNARQTPASAAQSTSVPRRPLVFYHPTVQQAWSAAVVKGRPLVVMFTSDHCHFCTKMLKTTYSHPGIQRLLATHTETVLAPSAANKPLIEQLGIRAYPTSIVVSPQGKIVAAIEGYVDPQTFVQRVAPVLTPPTQEAKQPAAMRQVAASSARN